MRAFKKKPTFSPLLTILESQPAAPAVSVAMSTAPRSRRGRSLDSRISRLRSFSITPSPPPKRSSKRRQSRREAYDQPRKGSRVTLILCVFHNTSHTWERATIKFDPNRTNDRELWKDIRDAFRADLEKPWRRILGFRKVKSVVPCTVCLSISFYSGGTHCS